MASRTIRVCDRTKKEIAEGDPVFQIHPMKITNVDSGAEVFSFGGWEEVSAETMAFALARMETIALQPHRGRKPKGEIADAPAPTPTPVADEVDETEDLD